MSADVFDALQGRVPDTRGTPERLAGLPASWEKRRAGLGEERHANRAKQRANAEAVQALATIVVSGVKDTRGTDHSSALAQR